MSHVKLEHVHVDYPIYDAHGRSLKLSLLRRVGGGLGRSSDGRVSIRALNDVNLTVRAGDRLGLIGPNGAGKSTLLKVLAGVYEPSMGTATISGNVSSLLDMSMGMDNEATGAENVILRAVFMGMSRLQAQDLLPDVEKFCELGDFFYLPMRTYSAGMSLRVAFAVATAIEPEILIMDELIGVGDAAFAAKAELRLQRLIGRAKILAIASHNHETIRSLCNRAIIVEAGALLFDGAVEEALDLYRESSTSGVTVASLLQNSRRADDGEPAPKSEVAA